LQDARCAALVAVPNLTDKFYYINKVNAMAPTNIAGAAGRPARMAGDRAS
jgi:hypothetical protein